MMSRGIGGNRNLLVSSCTPLGSLPPPPCSGGVISAVATRTGRWLTQGLEAAKHISDGAPGRVHPQGSLRPASRPSSSGGPTVTTLFISAAGRASARKETWAAPDPDQGFWETGSISCRGPSLGAPARRNPIHL